MGEPIVTPEAEADIDEAWDRLSRKSPDAADRLIERFLSSATRHAQFPNLGESCEHLLPGLRCFVVRPYVAFYRVEGENIRVLRFLHGRRDYKRLLGD